MDKFDQQILTLLSENARQSNAEIARKIGLSRTAVTSRIQKLEAQGDIRGYRAELAVHNSLASAYFHIQHSHGSCDDLIDEISAITPVRQCHSISGDIDMIVFAQAESMQSLERVRCRLAGLPRITSITTKAVLKELISR
jgi:DNA-binding Lrp family transcriptional regulator